MTLTSAYRPLTTLTFQTGPSTTEDVTCGLRAASTSTAQLLVQQLGLNASVVILEARLITPRRRPAALKTNHKAALTWGGRSGVATLLPHESAIPTRWRDTYGDKLLISWESAS